MRSPSILSGSIFRKGSAHRSVRCSREVMISFTMKQQMGGAMRQAGIIASACLYALDHNVERLREDHENARRLASGLAELDGVRLNPDLIDTNIIFFDLDPELPTARSVASRLLESGVRIGAMGERRMRAVTHLDIDSAAIDTALEAMSEALRA